jgi:hypothetical protein
MRGCPVPCPEGELDRFLENLARINSHLGSLRRMTFPRGYLLNILDRIGKADANPQPAQAPDADGDRWHR